MAMQLQWWLKEKGQFDGPSGAVLPPSPWHTHDA
jgi:hypothetical protein